MDKKTKILIASLLSVAGIMLAVLIFALFILGDSGKPAAPAVPDPASIVRSPAITGEESYQDVLDTREETDDLIGQLCADGFPIAYDTASDTYYLSVSDEIKTSPIGIAFSVTGSEEQDDLSIVFEDKIDKYSYFQPKNNQTYPLCVYNDAQYQAARIVVTTMPFLTVETKNGNAIGDSETDCTLTLRDGNWKQHGGTQYTEVCATMRTRGATSRGFEKKAYKVNLKESDWETKKNLSLLGLRNDDDWVLDALYIDPTRMHNKMATEIWNEMSPENKASDGEYVEVILNGKYVGLYDLIEPLDQKQLDLDEQNGLLIKAKGWNGTYFDKYDGQPNSKNWMDFEIKYPKQNINLATWADFFDLVSVTAESEEDPELFAYMMAYTDQKNLTDYWLFLTAFSLRDNRGKNLYWSTRDTTAEQPIYTITPWDCDLGFGYRFGKKDTTTLDVPHHRDHYENDYISDFKLLTDYLILDVDSSRQVTMNRWESLTKKGGVLSLESVLNRMNQYRTYLNETGAWAREAERWPDSMNPDQEEEFQYMEDWLKGRYEWMETRMDEMMHGFETAEEDE